MKCTNCKDEFERQHDQDAYLCDDCYMGVTPVTCIRCDAVTDDFCSGPLGVICFQCATPCEEKGLYTTPFYSEKK